MDNQKQQELERLDSQRKMVEGHLEQAQQRLGVTQDQFRSGAEADVRRYMDDLKRLDDKISRLIRG